MRKCFLVLSLVVSSQVLAQAAASAEALEESLWEHRDEPGVLQKLVSITDTELSQKPQDFEALWHAARVKQWLADGESDRDRRMALGKEAWALGDRASAQNPKAVQGYYYAALGIGAYSQGAGILKALGEGLEGKFNERLDTANRLDPNWKSAGGLVAKGRYFYELPWPKRNLAMSAQWLGKAIAAHPENLRAYVYLAETELRDGDAKRAQATLEKALMGSDTYDPPEARRAKRMAAPVKTNILKQLK